MESTVPPDVYGRLREAVLTLELAPGERITERTLEARLGASRTPIRAALLRLEADGLVRRSERAWSVAPIDIREVRALAELREAVEPAAVRRTVERASAADIAALSASLDDHAGEAADVAVRAGTEFHVLLASLSGNEPMTAVVRDAMTRLARTRWLEVRSASSRDAAAAEHRAIVTAVGDRDADRAARLVAAHIRETSERLVTVLRAEQARFGGRPIRIDGA